MTDPEIDASGTKFWHNERHKCHRLDGPAIEYANGTKLWYVNGLRHRTTGPAIEYANGTKFWYENGLLHRLDGPAIEYASGHKVWFIRGTQLTEAEFTLLTFACYNTL